MSPFDLIDLIPSKIQRQVMDSTIDFIANQAKSLLSDEISERIRRFRSDAEFQKAFEQAIEELTQNVGGILYRSKPPPMVR